MNVVSIETLRRVTPALFVGGVLPLSFFAASPTLASSTNNCGVKGYGYHDHGKVCPNRPFPGHGNGVLRILASLGVSSQTAISATVGETKKGKNHADSQVAAEAESSSATTTEDADVATGVGNGHGKTKGHGKGNGRNGGHQSG
ncbi:MAG: hypothetical protein E6J28_13105 [Chloroflexi bacterium]|nr:MAG: hypothetical protein E6J28_13105 [Chloroflexota bacterium]